MAVPMALQTLPRAIHGYKAGPQMTKIVVGRSKTVPLSVLAPGQSRMGSDIQIKLPLLLVAIVLFLPIVSAMNLPNCTRNIRDDWNSTFISNITNSSSPVITKLDWDNCNTSMWKVIDGSNNINLAYRDCQCLCGRGPGDFSLTNAFMRFCTWLLPWVTLMFQLPFGSNSRFVNLMSVLLAVGSPALAGYSLAITYLNNLWLTDQFNTMPNGYPNRKLVPTVLSALHHIPVILIDELCPFLALPKYNQWWESMAKASKKTRQWTIPTVMSIVWATLSIIVTVVTSFDDFSSFVLSPGDLGYVIADSWFYLLALVIGWLYIGSQPEANHLWKALEDSKSKVPGDDIAIQYDFANHGYVRWQGDENYTSPIFNYARVFRWSSMAERVVRSYRRASEKPLLDPPLNDDGWGDRRQVNDAAGGDNRRQRYHSVASSSSFELPEMVETSHPANQNEQQTVESHYSAERNSQQTVQAPHYTNRNSRQAAGSDSWSELELQPRMNMNRSLWAPHVIQRALIAAFLGLWLLWSTTGAAIIIHVKTPPVGIGCRALTLIIYGTLSTFVFLLMFLSSFMSHWAHAELPVRDLSHKVIGFMAYVLQWMGKYIGLINGLGIIAAYVMQLSGGYSNCFCSSQRFFEGKYGGDVLIFLMEQVSIPASGFYKYWIGGTAFAISSSVFFVVALYLASPMVTEL